MLPPLTQRTGKPPPLSPSLPRFGRRHRHRLAAAEQDLVEQGSSPVWAWGGAALLFAYICLLLWQVGGLGRAGGDGHAE